MSANGQPGVVITGIGAVSPFGVGRECYWHHLSHGISGCRAITQFDASGYPCRVAASVPPVSIDQALPLEGENGDGRADPKRYSRAALFGVIAAREAWCDAGLRAGEPHAGVLIGSGGGGIDIGEKQYEDFFTTGGRHVTPYAIAVGICGMVSSEISIALQLRGLSHVLSCGCTSSTDAIGYAVVADSVGRVRPPAVGRDRWLRAAGDDLRLFTNARGVDAIQRSSRGGIASLRSRARRVRSRRRRVDARARARGSRDCPRRETICARRGIRVDVRRVSPCADGSRRRRDHPLYRNRSGQGPSTAGGNRIRQLSRDVDTAERRDRIALRTSGFRKPRRFASRARRPNR